MSREFKARFAGQCAKCRTPIEPGDWAAYGEDGEVICRKCKEVEEDDGA